MTTQLNKTGDLMDLIFSAAKRALESRLEMDDEQRLDDVVAHVYAKRSKADGLADQLCREDTRFTDSAIDNAVEDLSLRELMEVADELREGPANKLQLAIMVSAFADEGMPF